MVPRFPAGDPADDPADAVLHGSLAITHDDDDDGGGGDW